MKAEVHAPINYRNYFNGHFNKHFKGTLRNTGTSVILITTSCMEEPCGSGRIHPSEMAHMEARNTLMLTIFGNFTSTGENQE